MGNRKRLDPGVTEQVLEHIKELLDASGEVTPAQRAVMVKLVERSERTINRLIDSVADGYSLVAERLPEEEFGLNSVEDFVHHEAFRFDDDMVRAALAYAGNLAALHADAERLAKKLGLETKPICYEQLTRKFNTELDNDEKGFIRRGIKGFKEASLYVRWSATDRNEVWQIDASTLDASIRLRGTNTTLRPDVIAVVDDWSTVILSAGLQLHSYNADDSASVVHRAMRLRNVTLPDGTVIVVGGLPGKVLCDNAQQFTGEVMSMVAVIVGFVMWAVAVYMGEKKGKVERVIRAINEGFARRLPGYANPNLKTLTMRDALRGSDADLLDEYRLLDELGKWVEEWNNSPHPRIPHMSRYEVWASSQAGLEEVDPALLRPATAAMPRTGGYVYSKSGFRLKREGNPRYFINPLLAGRVKDKFMLRHLPGDLDWVDAYTLDGEFVARCWDSELPEGGSREITTRRNHKYRTLASLRSEAVELRSLAAAEVADDRERPNALAVAHTRATASSSPDLVRASLGLPSTEPAAPAPAAMLALPAGDIAQESGPAATATPPEAPESLDDLVADALHAVLSDDGDDS